MMPHTESQRRRETTLWAKVNFPRRMGANGAQVCESLRGCLLQKANRKLSSSSYLSDPKLQGKTYNVEAQNSVFRMYPSFVPLNSLWYRQKYIMMYSAQKFCNWAIFHAFPSVGSWTMANNFAYWVYFAHLVLLLSKLWSHSILRV